MLRQAKRTGYRLCLCSSDIAYRRYGCSVERMGQALDDASIADSAHVAHANDMQDQRDESNRCLAALAEGLRELAIDYRDQVEVGNPEDVALTWAADKIDALLREHGFAPEAQGVQEEGT